jgi:hypothetical protein
MGETVDLPRRHGGTEKGFQILIVELRLLNENLATGVVSRLFIQQSAIEIRQFSDGGGILRLRRSSASLHSGSAQDDTIY